MNTDLDNFFFFFFFPEIYANICLLVRLPKCEAPQTRYVTFAEEFSENDFVSELTSENIL